jgi:hypothetical protein
MNFIEILWLYSPVIAIAFPRGVAMEHFQVPKSTIGIC